jgi:hypothetical protein
VGTRVLPFQFRAKAGTEGPSGKRALPNALFHPITHYLPGEPVKWLPPSDLKEIDPSLAPVLPASPRRSSTLFEQS